MMKRRLTLSFTLLLLVATAHRLPAPISEIPESPTPASTEQAKPKKTQSKSNAIESEPKTKPAAKPSATPPQQGPARFAGTWTGHIDFRNPTTGGDQACTITVDATETSVSGTFGKAGPFNNVGLRKSGNIVTWKYGWFGEYTATLTIGADQRTAVYTLTSPYWGTGSSTVTRN
jgi:hypothetical protein